MIQVQPSTKSVSIPGIKELLPSRPLAEKPLSLTKTVLVVSHDPVTRKSLTRTVRSRLNYRVLEAASIAEARYLAAVEGRIRLLLATSLSKEHLKFARWFLTVHPESKVVVAMSALWELTGGPKSLDQVLMSKSYSTKDLIATVRRLVVPPKLPQR